MDNNKDNSPDEKPEPSQGVEVELEVQAQPAAAKTEADSNNYYERLVRVSADFDNFRKRYQKEKGEWARYGAENFIKSFLPIIDNLERAITQCPEDESNAAIRQGLKMVLEQMYRNLQSEGVSAFSPLGQPFDPLLHEAITTVADDSQPPHTVLAVHHKGFKLWDRLLRSARVTVSVAKTPATAATDETDKSTDDV